MTINGRKNIPKDSAILCSNHNSHMDVALISSAAGKSFNHFGMLAAIDYWFDSKIKNVTFEKKIAIKKVNQSVVILVLTVIFFT